MTNRPDIRADARLAFDAIEAGGIAILPMDVGYSLIGSHLPALKTIFDTKKRTPSKLNAMIADREIQREVHVVDSRQRDIIDCITLDYDLPLGLIAPARLDHPILRRLDPEALTRSTNDGTVLMLLNAGPFHKEISRLSHEKVVPLFGSSANISLSGTKFRASDIEPEIRAIADVVIDYGLRKYHMYKQSSTLLNVATMRVVRVGSCFDLISDVLRRHFAIDLAPEAAA
jgi:tRNA A37 threonylcarbamoyladenosine synthetase subunit TsaC/SUA5/YrdC